MYSYLHCCGDAFAGVIKCSVDGQATSSHCVSLSLPLSLLIMCLSCCYLAQNSLYFLVLVFLLINKCFFYIFSRGAQEVLHEALMMKTED